LTDKEKKPEDRLLVSDIFTSKIYKKEDKTINGIYNIKESKGTGMINQILLKSDSNDYTIQIILDDSVIYYDPYSFLFTNSEHLDNISVYLAAGVYYLTIQNLFFQERFLIRIITDSSIIYDLIYIRYSIRNEINLAEGD